MGIGAAYRSTLSNVPLYGKKRESIDNGPSKNIKITDDEIRIIRTKYQKHNWSIQRLMKEYGSNISESYMRKLVTYEARVSIDVW